MLQIVIPSIELYDEEKNEFINTKEQILQLEHSLVSLSKWESKWCKPFLTKEEKTLEETIDYIRCMTITQNVDNDVYKYIGQKIINEVNRYIELPMTATIFKKTEKKVNSGEFITSEIIYYWMIALQVPFECQRWHLNRLLTLINVCNIKSQPSKKMSKKALYSRQFALNEARKAKYNTTG